MRHLIGKNQDGCAEPMRTHHGKSLIFTTVFSRCDSPTGKTVSLEVFPSAESSESYSSSFSLLSLSSRWFWWFWLFWWPCTARGPAGLWALEWLLWGSCCALATGLWCLEWVPSVCPLLVGLSFVSDLGSADSVWFSSWKQRTNEKEKHTKWETVRVGHSPTFHHHHPVLAVLAVVEVYGKCSEVRLTLVVHPTCHTLSCYHIKVTTPDHTFRGNYTSAQGRDFQKLMKIEIVCVNLTICYFISFPDCLLFFFFFSLKLIFINRLK